MPKTAETTDTVILREILHRNLADRRRLLTAAGTKGFNPDKGDGPKVMQALGEAEDRVLATLTAMGQTPGQRELLAALDAGVSMLYVTDHDA